MIEEFIAHCNTLGISMELGASGKLKINADRSVLTKEITEEIKLNKPYIIKYLQNYKLKQLDEEYQLGVEHRVATLSRLGLSESDIEGFYPLLPLQESMLLDHILNDGLDPYIVHFILKVDGQNVLDKVLRCFTEVVQRHASCRTSIIWRNVPQSYQLVKKRVEIPINSFNCFSEQELHEKLEELECSKSPMDLELDPLTRIHVLHLEGSNEKTLFIERHHITSDHISLEIMMHELVSIYNGDFINLPNVKQQFEYALEQNKQPHVKATYFEELLKGFDSPTLLFNETDFLVNTTKYRQPIDAQLQTKIRECSIQSGVSSASIFHLAWGMILSKFCDSKDVLFPTVLTGRVMHPDYRTTVGMFLNSLPCRIGFSNNTVRNQLKELYVQLLNLTQYEHVPLNTALEKGSNNFDVAFNCIFNYRYSQELDLDALPFDLITCNTVSTTPFSLSVTDMGHSFELSFDAATDYDGERLLYGYVSALRYIVSEIDSGSELPLTIPQLLNDQEVNELLNDLNNTAQPYPEKACIHDLFEGQVANAPEQTAVVFEGRTLSYRALNEKANQVAHYLRLEHGVGPDTLVGLCIERSLEMVIGIMGILKAGGAYVPLDPNYPAERL
ncbi:condensation domain-containing protein, partial [Pseudoalteromonas piscicida]|uniref:condensation domain-containing protein n=1 Tax=Pseudoalteromonas piscicida TaxID=43662 RepID=UPI001EFE401E